MNHPSSSPAPKQALIEYDHPASPQIGRWLRDRIRSTDNTLGRCYRLRVRHFSINKKPQGDVGDVPITEDDTRLTDEGYIDALVQNVIDMAQADANVLHSGLQLYAVFANYKGDNGYSPRCYFRVGANEEYDPESTGADPTEPANAQGLTSQLMRHIEAIQRSSQIQASYLFQTLQMENASQRQLIERQQAQSLELTAMMQEALDNVTHRRIEEKEAEINQGMKEGMFEQLKLLIPIAMNRLAGQKISPETDASFTALAALFESLSQEQQQELVTGFFNPAQAALFAEFLGTYEARKRKLTSKDAPGGKLNLPAMFDKRTERVNTRNEDPNKSSDPQLNALEGRAKSFKDAFRNLRPVTGPIKPAKT